MTRKKVWVLTHVVGGVVNGVLAFSSEDKARAAEAVLAKDYGLEPDKDGTYPWEESEDVDVAVLEVGVDAARREE